jgi:hypothetical protein
MSQETLRLRKTAPPDSMETAQSALSDIVKQAFEKEMQSDQRFSIQKLPDGNIISRDNQAMVRIQKPTPEQIIRDSARNLGISMQPEPDEPDPDDDEDATRVPPSWTKGQLLNVRNRGEFYVVTLLGEEDEPPFKPAPSGALRFSNTALCQDFVSKWYAAEHHDPRAR